MEETPKGIQIINDIFKAQGTETLEGKIGPLIFSDSSQSHFIELFPGMYCDEHPHDTGSIIYTAKGKWVLCSQGQRFLMETGSLFCFEPNISTGYEVPFTESALILIFKGSKFTSSPNEMTTYLEDLAAKLKKENQQGVPFTFDELPEDHPAKLFASML